MIEKQMGSRELALTMTSSGRERKDSTRTDDSARALERALAGDRAAFDELILRYQPRVLSTAWRLLGAKEDAQDAAQEVFLRLYRHLRRVDPHRPLLPWLYRMTVNVCHDLYRKRRRSDELAAETLLLTRDVHDPREEITRAERLQLIERALQVLTEKERTTLVLRDLEGLSTAEVAATLGSSESTVRSQISMARMKIKTFVERFEKGAPR